MGQIITNKRFRRLRQSAWVREMVAENHLLPEQLIQPIFLCDGHALQKEIEALPGQFVYSLDQLLAYLPQVESAGIKMIALFPVVQQQLKDANGTYALSSDNFFFAAIQSIKQHFPNLGLMVDVALDPYTLHGHDGVLDAAGDVDNDKTVHLLADYAKLLAASGADAVAPSDMMDGRIAAIRQHLDIAGHTKTLLVSYTVKYASHFYGPFRAAVGSTNKEGISKATYQLDYRNSTEAVEHARQDYFSGADMLIIKPGMPYLDIMQHVKQEVPLPIIGYQVSGEYAMLCAGAAVGAFNYHAAMLESLIALRRAGCRMIITYAAVDIAINCLR